MSLSLMSQNMCSYSGCSLSFANLYDLIAHIEFIHIPLIEEEQRQKCSQAVESDNRTAPNLPLSYVCRVFRTPYRTTPSKPEAFRLNWCHYRKRPPPQASILPPQQVPIQSATTVSGLLQANPANIISNANPRNPQNYIEMRDSRGMVAQNHQLPPQSVPVQLQQQPLPIPQSQSQHSLSHPHPHHAYHAPVSVSMPSVSSAPHLNLDIPNEVPVNNNPPEDLDECPTNDPEMRFKCTIIDCHLRYKNIHGLRNHLRVAHRIVFEDKNDVNQGYGDDLHGQLPSSPSKPHKCQYCSKRYKTPAGLTNHVNQAHQKTSGGYAGQNPEQAPSSPTVLAQLITQAQAERQHRTAMEQQQRNQAPPHSMMTHQRPLPVALAPNQHQVGQGQGQSQFQQPVHNQPHQHQYMQQNANPQPPLPVRSIGNYSQQPQGPMQRSSAYSGAIPSSTAGMQMQQPHSMHPPPQRRSHISHTQMAQQILQQGQLQQQMAQNQQQQGIPMQEMHPPHPHSQQTMMQRPEFYHNRPPPPNHQQQQQQQQQQTQHEVTNPNQPHYNQEMAEIAMDSSDAPGEENSDVLCFTPLGSGQEVGRSAHLLQFKGKKILLDCGVHPGMHGVDALPFVDFVDIENIDLLLITHFHLDHCGALPWLLQKTGFRGRCFMTHATKAIYRMLLGDYIRISRFGSAASDRTQLYTEDDLDKSMEKIEVIDFHEQKEVNGVRFWPYVAGHVLGACMFMIEIAGVKTLYTGDFSCLEDRHLCAAEIPNIQPDILISESTYGTQIHEPREEREKRFTQTVHDIVGRGGRCLIPAFALGRAQELLLILDEYWEAHPELHDIPVYYASSLAKRCMAVYQTFVSGMNERIQKQIAVNNPFVFKHISNLKGMAHFEDVGPCVVLASPGMLQNGLSRELFEQWCTDSKNGCIIAGYCVEGTLAKHILSEPEEIVAINGERLPMRMQIAYISFSAHTDYQQTLAFVKKLRPPHLILVHGEMHEMNRLKAGIARNFEDENIPIEIHNPRNTETIQLHFRGEKTAKVVGEMAKRRPNENEIVSGILVKRNFNFHILNPGDLSAYTSLQSSKLTQKQSLFYSASYNWLFFNLSQLDPEAKLIAELKPEDESGPTHTISMFNAAVLVHLCSKANVVVLEWESTPVADMLTDACAAAILHAESNPTPDKYIPKSKGSFADLLETTVKEISGDEVTVEKNPNSSELTVNIEGKQLSVSEKGKVRGEDVSLAHLLNSVSTKLKKIKPLIDPKAEDQDE